MAEKKSTVTLVNVFQGKQPLGSFTSEAEAQAFITSQKLECRRQGIDTTTKEHSFSTKVHAVTVEPAEVQA